MPAGAQTAPKPLVACSSINASVCVRVEFNQSPSSTQDNPFILTTKGTLADFQNLKIDVWMDMGGHGHGSAPVEIKSLGGNRYSVQNVWFVMTGPWDLKISFDSGAQHHEIKIPVQVLN